MDSRRNANDNVLVIYKVVSILVNDIYGLRYDYDYDTTSVVVWCTYMSEVMGTNLSIAKE